MTPFSLLSFNVLGAPLRPSTFKKGRNVRERLHAIGKNLDKLSPDIICFQEVFTYLHLLILRDHLKQYPFIVYKKHVLGPKGGLVIFSKLPLEKTEYTTFANKGSLKNLSMYGHIVRMGILCCRIKGSSFSLMNTHLIANFDHEWNPKNRYGKINHDQIFHLAEVIQNASRENDDVVLAGDLNMDKTSTYYAFFLKKSKMIDVFAKYDFPTHHQELLADDKTPKRIDYIFLRSKNKTISSSKTTHLFKEKMLLKKNKYGYLSDHIGLFTYIQ